MRLPLPSQYHVLYERNFRLYWIGQGVSLTGWWMQGFAASWVILGLTDNSALALAVQNFAFAIPGLVLMLYGGVLADRYDRRTILLVTEVCAMVGAFVGGALIATGTITFWLIILMSLLVGAGHAINMPAQQALVPNLVQPRQIPQAIALNQVTFNGSRFVGPALAGVLVATTGLASAYFVNGISYVAVLASLLLLRLPPGGSRGRARGSAFSALKEGLRYVARSPLLRSLLGISAMTGFLLFPPLAVLAPAYVRAALGRGPSAAAVMFAATGLASMVGGFAMLYIPAARRGAALALCIAGGSLSLLVMALTHNVVVGTVAFGLLSFAMGLVLGLNATTIQQVPPDAIRGRVMSVSGLTFSGVIPFAAIAIGGAVELAGIRPVYGACSVAYALLAGSLLWRAGLIGHDPQPQPEPIAPSAPERQAVAAR